VAVLDSGIDAAHPDLAGAVAGGASCVKGSKKDTGDEYGHGTHVAGTIAARDNAVGVVGVAPEATLYAVKVLDATGSGTLSNLVCGVDWVTANAGAIRVANLSLGVAGAAAPSNADCTNGNDDALHTAICQSVKAGITYVVAAGNEAVDAARVVPAAYEEVITVSALADFNGASGGGAAATCRPGVDDTFFSSSNYGTAVDLAAPGACILSAAPGGGHMVRGGTSMAAPHVAGAAALYLVVNPGASPVQVKVDLLAGQEPGPIPGDPDTFTEGIVHLR
jgi:subtilisin family serine protease